MQRWLSIWSPMVRTWKATIAWLEVDWVQSVKSVRCIRCLTRVSLTSDALITILLLQGRLHTRRHRQRWSLPGPHRTQQSSSWNPWSQSRSSPYFCEGALRSPRRPWRAYSGDGIITAGLSLWSLFSLGTLQGPCKSIRMGAGYYHCSTCS